MQPAMMFGVDEKAAGELQDRLDRLNSEEPPDHVVPFMLASFRHPCLARTMAGAKADGVSTNIETPEQYVMHEDGIHALIYRAGKCKKCGATVRSRQGRVVLAARRPPLEGRVSRV